MKNQKINLNCFSLETVGNNYNPPQAGFLITYNEVGDTVSVSHSIDKQGNIL